MKSELVSFRAEGASEFDLRNLSEGTEGGRRLSRLLWGAFFLGTVGIIVIASIAAGVGLVLIGRALLVDAIGVVFCSLFFMVYLAQGPSR